MSRVRTLAGTAIISGSVLLSAGVAGAQATPTTQYPGSSVPTTSTTAPTTTSTAFADDGNTAVGCTSPLGPGATTSCTVTDDDLNSAAVDETPNSNPVDGDGSSTPYSLGRATASNDSVTFSNVKLPADFARNANHSITVRDAATGQVLATKTFGVNASGAITAPISSTGLPKTGSDLVDPSLKVGGALLALGGVAVLVARRRKAEGAAAA